MSRVVAGAPVKHAPVVVRSKLIAQGTWREEHSDGSVWIVCDLTSALWTYGKVQPGKGKAAARR